MCEVNEFIAVAGNPLLRKTRLWICRSRQALWLKTDYHLGISFGRGTAGDPLLVGSVRKAGNDVAGQSRYRVIFHHHPRSNYFTDGQHDSSQFQGIHYCFAVRRIGMGISFHDPKSRLISSKAVSSEVVFIITMYLLRAC